MIEVRPAGPGRPHSGDKLELLLWVVVLALSFGTPARSTSGERNAPLMDLTQKYTGGGLCLFKRATGIECAGCGLTRGFVQLAHAHPAEAVASNPLSPVFFLLVLGRLAASIALVAKGFELQARIPSRGRWFLWGLLAFAMAGLGVWRVVLHFAAHVVR